MSMSRSSARTNGQTRFRRSHRWVGTVLVAFVLYLAVTGILLNHSSDFGLDRQYIGWSWLLDAYGMGEPEPYAGRVEVGPLVVVGDGRRVHVLLESGELVETIDLAAQLPQAIARLGRAGDRAVLQSGDRLYQSDDELTIFEAWDDGDAAAVSWSREVEADTEGLEALQAAWRGQGLTVERVLLDLHSGRIFSLPGRLLMDILAIGMILLGVSGLLLARRRNGSR
jgi:hypothetical protein